MIQILFNYYIQKKYYFCIVMKMKNTKKDEPKEWKIVLYETETGRCPVNNFINTLDEEDKQDMLKGIQYLKSVGNNIRRPHGDILRDKIYELRITLKNNITRTLFFFYNADNEIVLTHAFNKKTDKVPDKEIEKAIKYRKQYLQNKNK